MLRAEPDHDPTADLADFPELPEELSAWLDDFVENEANFFGSSAAHADLKGAAP